MKDTAARRAGPGSKVLPQVILTVIILLISLTCLLPFVNVAATSLSSKSAILSGRVSFFPVEFDFRAYKAIFSDPAMTRSLVFTIVITVVYTVFSMILTILRWSQDRMDVSRSAS